MKPNPRNIPIALFITINTIALIIIIITIIIQNCTLLMTSFMRFTLKEGESDCFIVLEWSTSIFETTGNLLMMA